MKNKKLSYLVLIPIFLFIALTAFGGGVDQTTAAGGTCYQVFMPMVIGNGGGSPGGPSANPCGPGGGTGGNVEADFNGDGYSDLAIGSPDESVLFNGVNYDEAGAVNVLYGTASGLSTAGNQIWSRGDADIYLNPATGDHFGQDLAVGDFDDDGYDDLAIAVPNSYVFNPGLVSSAGVVQVLYGSAAGLTADRDEVWAQSTGLQGIAQANDNFGSSVAVGDFDYDGYDDLAVGVTGEDVDGVPNAGAINIIFGSSNGLDQPRNQFITQATGDVSTSPATNDYFGYAMTTGDFNADGIDDLAVGIPDEDIPTTSGNLVDAGAVQIMYGNGYGLYDTFTNSVTGSFWYGDSNPYVGGAVEAGDRFGHSVEAGDFNGDTYDDLAVGLPSETHGEGGGSIIFAGAINVFYGSISGIDATAAWPAPLWHQDSPGMLDEPEFAERFGYSLAASDFNNDGYVDLAIGVPYEENNLGENVGAVSIMYGTSVGLSTANNALLFQGTLLVDQNDQFGLTLTVADYNGDGFGDLGIGAPNDSPDVVLNTGSVAVRYSDSNGVPTSFGQDLWHQGSPGLIGSPETGESFGGGLP